MLVLVLVLVLLLVVLALVFALAVYTVPFVMMLSLLLGCAAIGAAMMSTVVVLLLDVGTSREVDRTQCPAAMPAEAWRTSSIFTYIHAD